ncbi:MAG: deoxyribodipyrimidine photo-lyase [Rhodospirillaceae bacterium]|nr:deoxyribodipyrimidine photo-lyase [Rhodospirillaceae bacterium]
MPATSPPPIIVWFRQDLRVADNPALHAAAATGRAVAPVYILDNAADAPWPLGGASRWWLHGALAALQASLAKLGAPLILRQGDSANVLAALIKETGADALYWNRCYEPAAIERDKDIKTALKARHIDVQSFNSALLFEPWEIRTQSETPFKVFTPFHKAVLNAPPPRTPLAAPKKLVSIPQQPASDALEAWNLRPTKPDWAGGLRAAWSPGEAAAKKRLSQFLDNAVAHYAKGRDVPGEALTSRLSPHLHFGEISPHHIWHATLAREQTSGTATFLKELVWREFAYHLLYHFPVLPDEPLRPEFKAFPWKADAKLLRAWQRGLTGYPIVDAGLRELWATGWMHNRVRMIAASLLVKHLLQPWQAGAAWFWDTLVDADLANNSTSWQWVAGCGTDAAPYFRVFNPVLQGLKFDAGGAYVRRWVPEIARLPDEWLHKPWDAPEGVLKDAGVMLGRTYPIPVVSLNAGRDRALAAFKTLRVADETDMSPPRPGSREARPKRKLQRGSRAS